MRLRNRLFLIVALILILGISVTSAQESSFTLRGLADQNGVYIGAAVWTNHLDDAAHRYILTRDFNMFVPEHQAKWCMLSSGPNQYDFTHFDTLVDFAEANDMVIRGHTLVWHSCSPDWVEHADYSRDEAVDALRKHIMTVMGRYKGRIKYWDVVNEAFDGAELRDTAWLRMIGEDYIELAFQFAHEADPDAVLYYNDYGAEQMGAKADAVYAMAKDFIERGVPIHGVGMQGHFELGGVNIGSIAENIQRLGELGLEVQFTEIDVKYPGAVDDDTFRLQAADYYRLLETCLDSEYCTAFVIWGVTDKFSWLRNSQYYSNENVEPLIFDVNYQPKPAYYAMMDLLARRVGETSILSDDEIAAILDVPTVDTSIAAPTKSDPNQLAPDAMPGLLYYAPFPVSITLDGDLSDWENVPRVLVDSGPSLGIGDTSFEFAAAADDTNFYFMADVTDSVLVHGLYGADEWWREDGVEFYLNATGNLEASSYVPGIVQIGVMLDNITNPETPLIGGSSQKLDDVQVAVVESDKGYIVEASVPLVIPDFWNIVPEHMGILGFQAHLNGASASDRDTKLIWSLLDTQDQSYNNPSLFGRLMFWDVTQ